MFNVITTKYAARRATQEAVATEMSSRAARAVGRMLRSRVVYMFESYADGRVNVCYVFSVRRVMSHAAERNIRRYMLRVTEILRVGEWRMRTLAREAAEERNGVGARRRGIESVDTRPCRMRSALSPR